MASNFRIGMEKMEKPFTPKQVALAIGVSESSVKRWCDKGKIFTKYTAGGHRRISTSGLLTFLRNSRHELRDPQAIGLPDRLPIVALSQEDLQVKIVNALTAGDEVALTQIAIELFLAEHSIAKICDEYIATALHKVGDLWQCNKIEVYQERLACQMSQRILALLRNMIPAPPENAPVAIGAAPAGDLYSLPSMMVELVLRDLRWNSTSMGENVPLASLAAAIRTYSPKLFWLSATYLKSEDSFVSDYTQLFTEFGHRVKFVIGGQALTEEVRQRINFSMYCENLEQFKDYVNSLQFGAHS